MLQNEGVSAVR